MKDGFNCHFKVPHGDNEFIRGPVLLTISKGLVCAQKTLEQVSQPGRRARVKECEFRFSYRTENLFSLILTNLIKSLLN